MKRLPVYLLLLFLIFTAQAFAQRYTVFPQFASGSGWSCELFLANQGLSLVSGITVSFYDDNGASLSVPTNLGTRANFIIDLNPGSNQVIRVTPSSGLTTGYVIIRYPSGAFVRATEVYRYEENGAVLADVGAPQQEIGEHFSFPAETDPASGIRSAVALVNTGDFNVLSLAEEKVVVSLVNPDGTVRKTATVTLKAGEHKAGYLDESWLFPDIGNFTGSVTISSPAGVGVLALRQDKQAFGAVSTDRGPIQGAFTVTGTPVQETEPNNTSGSAQLIAGSTIVSGSIGSISDVDYYKFEGKAGDIVTIIAQASDTSYLLDTIIIVSDSNQNAIAANNDSGLMISGLMPQNDSFEQLVLPADGTYYIWLSDLYYGQYYESSISYAYTLQVRLP